LASAVQGPSVASALIVLERNNYVKLVRAFEHLLTGGENQQGAAAAVQLCPCCGRTLIWELINLQYGGHAAVWIGRGSGLNTW